MSDEVPFPPRRTRETLQEWVRDFEAQTDAAAVRIVVAEQDGEETRDTGLVIIQPVGNPAMAVYMQARGFDDPLWEVTLPARDQEVPMSVLQLGQLGTFTSLVATLCSYLQWRSLESDRESGRHSF